MMPQSKVITVAEEVFRRSLGVQENLPIGKLPVHGRKSYAATTDMLQSRYWHMEPSNQLILRKFGEALSLVTISRDRVIIDRENLHEKKLTSEKSMTDFRLLMSNMKNKDENHTAVMTWVMNARDSTRMDSLLILQDTLRYALDDEITKVWLAERAGFVIADVDMKVSDSSSDRQQLKDRNGQRLGLASSDFFRTFSYRPWSQFSAFTAFVNQTGRTGSFDVSYASHRMIGKWVCGLERSSYSKRRNYFVKRFYDATKELIGDVKSKDASSDIAKAGFKILSLDDFLSFNK